MHAIQGVVAAACVAACTSNPPTLNNLRDPIIGGSAATAGQYPTVVSVIETQAGSLCTGTLISSTAILTAAHCVDPAELGRTAPQVVAETIAMFDNVDPFNHPSNGFYITAQLIYENPNHPDFTMGGTLGHDDDAIIILSRPVTDRMPSQVDLDPTVNQIGVEATQVGFGISQLTNNTTPNQNSAGVEYVLANKPVVDCGTPTDNANLLCFDQSNHTGQCNGDSGGPAFNPAGVVIGVVSFGDANCTQFGADTRPSQTAAFIQQYVPNINSAPVCGNGIVEYGEQCDTAGASATCTASCTLVMEVCGNGIVEAPEACDDGSRNGQAGDPCTTSCTLAAPSGSGSGSGSGSSGDNTGSGAMHDGGGCSTSGGNDVSAALLLAALVAWRRRRR